MTWSILARDASGRLGAAIASRFFAVGALCVHTRRGVGVLATQALMNPLYGPQGLALLAAGRTPQEVIAALTGADAGREHRQLHLLPADGAAAAWTGAECIAWCGHRGGADFSVAGNMLAGAQVLEATAEAFEQTRAQPLAERLLAALAAGEAAGGDKRGKQSAALRIHADEDYPQLDIRVDDHEEPVRELQRLYRVSLERFQPFLACLPGRHDATGLIDRARIEERIAGFQREAGEGRLMALLEVRDLRTTFATEEGLLPAVDGVSLAVEAGQTLAIVGESGCGKSVTALSIMGLVAPAAGSIRFEGRELVGLSRREMLDLRGNGMAMIFQEPMTSLNPAFPVGEQIVEGLLRHRALSRAEAQERAIEVLRQVRIPAPEQRFHEYPHKLSGGMRQRVMIAMALACRPRLLIADEPTTALDVTIQAQILELMATLQEETGTAVILITHDLGVVAGVADHVAVMYAGRIVEQAPVHAIFEQPQHPYTVGLLGSIPRLDLARARLAAIEGQVPDPLRPPPGCRFAERCPFVLQRCRAEAPPLLELGAGHLSACWRAPLDPDALLAPALEAVA